MKSNSERGLLATSTAAVEESWTGELKGAKQGPERPDMRAFGFEGGAAVRAGRAPVEKRIHLVVQQAFLNRVEELFGLLECQAQMLDALSILLQGDDVGDDFFLAIIAAHDELEFDVHGRAPVGLRGGCMCRPFYRCLSLISSFSTLSSPCLNNRTEAYLVQHRKESTLC
jgi:hypothetical protein